MCGGLKNGVERGVGGSRKRSGERDGELGVEIDALVEGFVNGLGSSGRDESYYNKCENGEGWRSHDVLICDWLWRERSCIYGC